MQSLLFKFQTIKDATGKLVAIEGLKDIPFEIKRVYYIYGVNEGARRGFHAHRELEQILICIHGSCKIMLDDGTNKTVVTLADPCHGLLVGKMIWREMFDFSRDAVLLVLASEPYNEADYIRNYDEFIRLVNAEVGVQND